MIIENESHIAQHLGALRDPVLQIPFNDPKICKAIKLEHGNAWISLEIPYLQPSDYETLKSTILNHFAQRAKLSIGIILIIKSGIKTHKPQPNTTPKRGIKNIIAVASGKGGVGKSTVALNLALALSQLGANVGLLDADIYGPSQPTMLGKKQIRAQLNDKKLTPIKSHGIETMSIGYLIDEDVPMIWRGPMVSQAVQQLLNDTDWSPLDYLIVDLPPGTGDIQLTMAQKIPVSGAVLVTTPQDVALVDVYKAYHMFEKLEIPVLGVIENMSYFVCDGCDKPHHIFGEGGGARFAESIGVELLATLPLLPTLGAALDHGNPCLDHDAGFGHFVQCAARMTEVLAGRPIDYTNPLKLVVTD